MRLFSTKINLVEQIYHKQIPKKKKKKKKKEEESYIQSSGIF